MNSTIYIVAKNNNLLDNMQKAKDRMCDYAFDTFADGEAYFTHYQSAVAYKNHLNGVRNVAATQGLEAWEWKVYKVEMRIIG